MALIFYKFFHASSSSGVNQSFVQALSVDMSAKSLRYFIRELGQDRNRIVQFCRSFKISDNDLKEELNNIKMCELQIGNGLTTKVYPELNPLQKKILQVLNINPEKMIQ